MSESLYYLKLGFTDDSKSWLSSLTRKATGGPSHVSVHVFEVKPNGQHERYYFESILKTDASTHKTGVRGPIPLTNLLDWLTSAEGRMLVTVPDDGYLPLTQEEARAAVRALRDSVQLVHYARAQLLGNLLAALLKVRLTFGEGSPLRFTCCELPVRARVLPARFWDLLGLDNINADELWPGGPSRYSLMAGVQRVIAVHGSINV